MRLNRTVAGKSLSRRSAFTVMEAVVAMAVVGVLGAALFGGMAWTTFSIRLARENLRATQIMVEKMEVIRTFTWDQINTPEYVPSTFTAPYYENGSANKAASGLVYTGTVTLSRMPGATQNYKDDLRLVTLNLAWTSGGLLRNRQLNTCVARYGLQNYLYN